MATGVARRVRRRLRGCRRRGRRRTSLVAVFRHRERERSEDLCLGCVVGWCDLHDVVQRLARLDVRKREHVRSGLDLLGHVHRPVLASASDDDTCVDITCLCDLRREHRAAALVRAHCDVRLVATRRRLLTPDRVHGVAVRSTEDLREELVALLVVLARAGELVTDLGPLAFVAFVLATVEGDSGSPGQTGLAHLGAAHLRDRLRPLCGVVVEGVVHLAEGPVVAVVLLLALQHDRGCRRRPREHVRVVVDVGRGQRDAVVDRWCRTRVVGSVVGVGPRVHLFLVRVVVAVRVRLRRVSVSRVDLLTVLQAVTVGVVVVRIRLAGVNLAVAVGVFLGNGQAVLVRVFARAAALRVDLVDLTRGGVVALVDVIVVRVTVCVGRLVLAEVVVDGVRNTDLVASQVGVLHRQASVLVDGEGHVRRLLPVRGRDGLRVGLEDRLKRLRKPVVGVVSEVRDDLAVTVAGFCEESVRLLSHKVGLRRLGVLRSLLLLAGGGRRVGLGHRSLGRFRLRLLGLLRRRRLVDLL